MTDQEPPRTRRLRHFSTVLFIVGAATIVLAVVTIFLGLPNGTSIVLAGVAVFLLSGGWLTRLRADPAYDRSVHRDDS